MQSRAGLTFRRREVAKAVSRRSADLVIAGVIAFASACQDVAVSPVAVVNVEVQPETDTIILGETRQLSVVVTDGAGRQLKGRTVAWSSEDDGVADVDAEGVVTALGVGTTRIVAAAEGRTGRGTITVTPKPVASVMIEPDALTLWAGGEETIHAIVLAADSAELTDRDVDWSTSDPSIVQVTGQGPSRHEARVEALDCPRARPRCTAQIAAAAEDVTDTITATVRKVPAQITITADRNLRAPLTRRATAQLTAKVEAADGTDLTEEVGVLWSSSDEDIATVDQTGKVTAVGCPGITLFCDAIISATVTEDPVEVNAQVEVEVFRIGTAALGRPAALARDASATAVA